MSRFKELMSNIKYGNEKRIKEILSYTNIDEALAFASKNCDLKRIKYLVEHNANIFYDRNLLGYTILNNDFESFKYLHKIGLNIHVDNDFYLYFAIRYNRFNIVQYLIDNNCKVKCDSLRCAIINSDLDMFKLLMSTNINIFDDRELLKLSVEHSKFLIFNYLITELKYNCDIETALFISSENYNKFEFTKFLLENNTYYNTDKLILIASEYNNTILIKYLFNKGIINDNNINISENMLLENAIINMNSYLVDCLIEHGCKTNINLFNIIKFNINLYKYSINMMECFIKHFNITDEFLLLDFSECVKKQIVNHLRYKKLKQIN